MKIVWPFGVSLAGGFKPPPAALAEDFVTPDVGGAGMRASVLYE